MGIKIGNNNKFNKTNIIENLTGQEKKPPKRFNDKHPIIVSLIISIVAGLILMFGFLDDLIQCVENFFKG